MAPPGRLAIHKASLAAFVEARRVAALKSRPPSSGEAGGAATTTEAPTTTAATTTAASGRIDGRNAECNRQTDGNSGCDK
jgi:hypothetical protein